MAFIRTIPPDQATGALQQVYKAAKERAGKVYNILQVQSLNPKTLRASIGLYQTICMGPSPLTRAEREMVAVVVSKTNDCFY